MSERSQSTPGHPEARALEVVVRRLVREELRGVLARLLDDEPSEFSSRKGHAPPGYAHRQWQALAKRIGMKRGRWYVVTHAQLEAHEAAQRTEAVTDRDPKPANDAPASTWSPAAALAAAGLRRSQ